MSATNTTSETELLFTVRTWAYLCELHERRARQARENLERAQDAARGQCVPEYDILAAEQGGRRDVQELT